MGLAEMERSWRALEERVARLERAGPTMGILVLGGLKLMIDLPAGHATTMVVALALYGGAMVIAARRRTVVAT